MTIFIIWDGPTGIITSKTAFPSDVAAYKNVELEKLHLPCKYELGSGSCSGERASVALNLYHFLTHDECLLKTGHSFRKEGKKLSKSLFAACSSFY